MATDYRYKNSNSGINEDYLVNQNRDEALASKYMTGPACLTQQACTQPRRAIEYELRPNEKSVIGQHFGELEDRVNVLHELLGQLESRLNPVLSCCDVPKACDPKQPRQSLSSFADSLVSSHMNVEAANERIRVIVSRLEL